MILSQYKLLITHCVTACVLCSTSYIIKAQSIIACFKPALGNPLLLYEFLYGASKASEGNPVMLIVLLLLNLSLRMDQTTHHADPALQL